MPLKLMSMSDLSVDYTDSPTLEVAATVKTDSNGRLRAYFELPNNRNQRFPTGMRQFKNYFKSK